MSMQHSNIKFKTALLAGTLVAAFLGPCLAFAALGEPETSVQTDVTVLRASIKVTEHASYRVHEVQLPSGTALREFVGPDGRVFAVAWSGPTMPNLRQTLGSYFDHYVAAAKASRSGRHHLEIQRSDLVVQAGGHMRAFSGRAYLPQSVPAGVALGDLR